MPNQRLLTRTLLVAVAIASIGLGSELTRRWWPAFREQAAKTLSGWSTPVHPEPLPLDEPIEVRVPLVPLETNWEIHPAIGDLDGDGRADLLVGSGKGRMQYHRNVGTAARPEFAPPVWFDELCPNGRIPTG